MYSDWEIKIHEYNRPDLETNMERFPVAIVHLLDGRKFYARDYPSLHRALTRIGENREERIDFAEMTEEEYHAIGADQWSYDLTR